MSVPTDDIKVAMPSETLWKKYFEVGNEQTYTAIGRKIFPRLEYSITGLEPTKLYSMSLHFERADNMEVRRQNEGHYEILSNKKMEDSRKIKHFFGEQDGSIWMKQNIRFNHVKIRSKKSKETEDSDCVFLHLNHRYIPVLTVYEGVNPIHVAKPEYTKFLLVAIYYNKAVRDLNREYRCNKIPSSRSNRQQPQSVMPSSMAGSQGSTSSQVSNSNPFPDPSIYGLFSPLSSQTTRQKTPVLPILPTLSNLFPFPNVFPSNQILFNPILSTFPASDIYSQNPSLINLLPPIYLLPNQLLPNVVQVPTKTANTIFPTPSPYYTSPNMYYL
ncbi:hypothetical protein GCK72_022800 [Caenorhabditis remanei]|uniref:T-box domain-containing protein n=1 Tax=Caenorhabditis remanei TaxID=31234 RepID=A0A6A5FUS7_CAERE|nr:hypothetical protein GCK72_022800 [Caenorhabditis remanei]KAF1746347.1 hypothetical protein GCK72_022800 [Caenorhabditis remanei]